MKIFPELEKLKEELESAGSIKVAIKSQAMIPLIGENEVVDVEKILDFDSLNRFDLICFFDGTHFNSHYYWRPKKSDTEYISARALSRYKLFNFPIHKTHVLGKVRDKKLSVFKKLSLTIMDAINID